MGGIGVVFLLTIIATLIIGNVPIIAGDDRVSFQHELCSVIEKMNETTYNLEIIKKLIKKGASPLEKCPDSFYPMYKAGERGITKVLKYFIEDLNLPPDANRLYSYKDELTGKKYYSGYTPLYGAIEKCQGRTVYYLLKKGANPHVINLYDPLEIAIGKQYYKWKKALIEAAMYGMKDRANLIKFRLYDCLMTVGLVLEFGADPNRRLMHNRTLLHIAAIKGLPEVYEFLLKYGAKEDIVDDSLYTPKDLRIKHLGKDLKEHPYYLNINAVYELLNEIRKKHRKKD